MSEESNQILTATTTPKWFMVVSILALVWNLMGVIAFVDQIMMTPERIAKLPQAEQELYAVIPIWVNIAFAFAVLGGALGSFALILKKMIATNVLIASLTGVLVQMFHSFFIIDSFAVYGPGVLVMPIMVVIIAVLLVRLSMKAKYEHWLK